MKAEIEPLTGRIIELETRLAFQDNTIEELNGVIISQQQQLDRLETGLAAMKSQLKQLGPGAEGANYRHDY